MSSIQTWCPRLYEVWWCDRGWKVVLETSRFTPPVLTENTHPNLHKGGRRKQIYYAESWKMSKNPVNQARHLYIRNVLKF